MRRSFAALAAAALVLAAPPVAAQEDDPTADHLAVVQQTPWVVPGGTFAMRLRVDDAPDDAQLRVGLHDRVRTRSEFARTLGGQGLRRGRTDRRVTALDALPVDDDGSILLRIVTGSVTGETPHVVLDADDEGVYPVLVELLDGDDEVVDRLVTHLIRLPDPDPGQFALGAAIVVPMHAPPSHVAPGEIDTTTLAPLTVTMDVLLDHPGVAATLVPTPEAIAAVVEADPAAAGRAAELAVSRQVLAGPWARLDRVAWRRAGLTDELDRQLGAGRAGLAAALGEVPDDRTAVVPPGGGAAAVTAAVEGGARAVIVPEDDLEALDEDTFPLTLTRPFEVAADGSGDDTTVAALVADAALAAHADLDDPVLGAHRLLADLAVLALDAPRQRRAAVVVLDDGDTVDHAFLDALFAGLDQPSRNGAAPLVRATTIAETLAGVDPAGDDGGVDPDDPLVREVVEGDDPPSLAALRDDLAGARAAVASYRSVFGPDDSLAGEMDELVLTAGAAALSGAERDTLLAAGVDRLRGELGAIHAPARQRVTLTAREGQVQLVIANDTGRPADVTVELRGDRLEFPDHPEGQVPVHLVGATTRVDLDVRARSSGDAPLDLRVLTPDGRVELGRSRITVRTTAVSGVGLVLMAAAALFLIVWWTRTILRERGSHHHRHPAHAR